MADLKMTLTDSEDDQEQTVPTPQVETDAPVNTKKQKKRDAKGKKKNTGDEAPLMLDQNFNLIDDSIRKDLSKITHKREYDATKQSGTSWKYQNAVKEDVYTNKSEDPVTVLRNRIVELRKELNMEEFEKGLEEIYRGLNKNIQELKLDSKQAASQPAKKVKPKVGTAAKVHYEKEDLISFHDLFLSRPLVKACNNLEFDHPTRIQNQVIPNIIENRDLLVNAVTGSGKTASYLLPVLEKLYRRDLRTSKVSNSKIAKTRVIILHPTRELAAQCSSMLDNLSKYIVPKISYATIIGGSSIKRQEAELADRPDIIIATPGRILDIVMNSKSIYFNNIETVILDEADKLLEMGFTEMIEELLKNIKKDSDVDNIQTLLFSATLSKDIKRLAKLALNNPQLISEAKQQNSVNAHLKLSHYVIKVPNVQKPESAEKKKKEKKKQADMSDSDSYSEGEGDSDSDQSYGDGLSDDEDKARRDMKRQEKAKKKLKEQKSQSEENKQAIVYDKARVQRIRESIVLSLVLKTFNKKTIIFLNKKSECHRLFVLFTLFGLRAAEVHGNLSQKQRMESVERFQSGDVDFLLATDLLARGLDIYNVQAVINFAFPNEDNRYIHRVGRTARAGNSGTAITLCNDDESFLAKKVIKKSKSTAKSYSYPKSLRDNIFTLIHLAGEAIANILNLEREDYQMARAEMELKKAQNILDYQEEIYNKPKKEWFQSSKQKEDANKQGKDDMETMRSKAIKKKLKMIEKIKDKKKNLRDQEYREMQFEKREKKRAKRGKKPNKQQDQPMAPRPKKTKNKKIHGKNSIFKQEI